MTGELAGRLVLEAGRQELNLLACSLEFAGGPQRPWLRVHWSLNMLGVYRSITFVFCFECVAIRPHSFPAQ